MKIAQLNYLKNLRNDVNTLASELNVVQLQACKIKKAVSRAELQMYDLINSIGFLTTYEIDSIIFFMQHAPKVLFAFYGLGRDIFFEQREVPLILAQSLVFHTFTTQSHDVDTFKPSRSLSEQ